MNCSASLFSAFFVPACLPCLYSPLHSVLLPYTRVDCEFIKPQTRTPKLSRQCKPAVPTVESGGRQMQKVRKITTCYFYCTLSESKTKHLLEIRAADNSRRDPRCGSSRSEASLYPHDCGNQLYRGAGISDTLFCLTNNKHYLLFNP